MTSVAQALAHAQRNGVERVDAQQLLCHLLNCSRSHLFSHADELLNPHLAQRYGALCGRLADGEPLAYLLGVQPFRGLDLQVSPAVLVPRPDTEVLVDWALELLTRELSGRPAPQVVDLGTGSGAVALAIKHAMPTAQVTATDASAAALAVAETNSRGLQLEMTTLVSDWWQALADLQFDLVVSNPPYIRGDDPHLRDLSHEPRLALTPGGDGLDAYRQILGGAGQHVKPGAWVLFEHGWDQAEAVCGLLTLAGLQQVSSRADVAGRPRCSGARWPG